jgi:hypothetical protein
MEPESSLPCSQQPATATCPEPDESNPHPQIRFPLDPFNVILLRVCIPGGRYRSDCRIENF